jgi:squalene synthase HpnC
MTASPEAQSAVWTASAAFAYCESLAREHYENFPIASCLVPRSLRPHICSIYAFARSADDFADERQYEGERVERLDEWEARLDRCLQGRPQGPIFTALAETIRTFDLPDRWLRDLLDAFRQDCRVKRYESWDELLDYCRRSANPVGRMVLHLFGYTDDQRGSWSDAICTALQLTNFWQDVEIDWEKDRVYLPAQARRRHGVSEDDIRARRMHEGFRALLREMTGRTHRLFEEGKPLLGRVPGRLALELRAVWLGGMRILDKIEKADGDVFRKRPALSRLDFLLATGRALLGGGTSS